MQFLCISDHILDLSSISFLMTFIGHVTFKRKYRGKNFNKWIRNHDVVIQSLSHIRFFYDHMDCSPPGTSVHGWDFSGKNTRVHCHFLLQGIFLTRN